MCVPCDKNDHEWDPTCWLPEQRGQGLNGPLKMNNSFTSTGDTTRLELKHISKTALGSLNCQCYTSCMDDITFRVIHLDSFYELL